MAQAKKKGISASRTTVTKALMERKRAGMFKAARQKEITESQQLQRLQYAVEKKFYAIYGFRNGVMFTDEAHMALDDFSDKWVLRVIGERYNPENIIEPPEPGRRPTTETTEMYHDRVRQWEAEKARIPEVIKPGTL